MVLRHDLLDVRSMDFGSTTGPVVCIQGFDGDFKEALKCRAGTVWGSGRSWTYV